MFSKFNNRQKGFTLIELMIVVVIIGILAALAIPRFMEATKKAKQSEAKTILKQIYTLERTYRQAEGEYSDVLDDIGFDLPPNAKYDYEVTGTDPLVVTATGNAEDADLTGDIWTIDADGDIAAG